MNWQTTKLTRANTKSKSLRTTIPNSIREILELTDQDKLDWKIDKIDGEWIVMVKKSS